MTFLDWLKGLNRGRGHRKAFLNWLSREKRREYRKTGKMGRRNINRCAPGSSRSRLRVIMGNKSEMDRLRKRNS